MPSVKLFPLLLESWVKSEPETTTKDCVAGIASPKAPPSPACVAVIVTGPGVPVSVTVFPETVAEAAPAVMV